MRQDRFLREIILHTALTRNRRFLSNDDLMEKIGPDYNGRMLIPVSILPFNIEQSLLALTVQAPYPEITLSSLLDNALEELTAHSFDYYKTSVENATVFVFFIAPDRVENFYKQIQPLMEELCELFQKKYSLILDIVIGNESPNIDRLFSCYQEIQAAYMVGFIAGEHGVIRTPNTQRPPGNGSQLADEYVQLLLEAVEHHSWDNAWRIISDYIFQLEENGYPFHILRYHVYSFVSLLLDMLPLSLADAGNSSLHNTLDTLASCGNLTHLKQSLWKFAALFFADVPDIVGENSGIFPQVDVFIRQNYNNTNLSLAMIADNIGLSVKYISKLFKLETGQGLLSYISSIRINKAKELLNEGHYTLIEISEMVGYASNKTFRRVFQKIEGINPSKYRANIS
jgi:AraC-like DNA-binding protein